MSLVKVTSIRVCVILDLVITLHGKLDISFLNVGTEAIIELSQLTISLTDPVSQLAYVILGNEVHIPRKLSIPLRVDTLGTAQRVVDLL